jgi:hypothetical protein
MSTTLDLSGLDRTVQRLGQLKNLDATDLMLTWMKVIDEDNRRGILQGLDKDGIPMVPVSYRPKAPGPLRVNKPPKPTKMATIIADLKRQRLNQRASKRKGAFAGFGPMSSGLHNNLTTAEYQLLGGPPLAPRDQFSRVITNFKTTFGGPPHGAGQWFAMGAWDEVVSTKGVPFLKWHFHSVPSKLPRRDLRGVRPAGIAKALDALRNWARLKVRELFE